MMTPDEILKRAERKFYGILRDWLSGETFSCIEFPVGTLSPDLTDRRHEIDLLHSQSKAVSGTGYTLEYETHQSRTLGKQTTPSRVIIAELADYLALIRKRTVFDHFVADVRKLRQAFPQLEDWLRARPQDVIEQHGEWDGLITVCDYFVKNPRPNMYIRELPIPVHTKFIEQNSRILRELLDILLTPQAINRDETDFSRRFGLKDKPALVRLRLLEEQLDWTYGIRVDDLSLPVRQVGHLLEHHIKPRKVIIVENLINFLTLPKTPNSVGLFGGGFAIHLLREVHWLTQCEVIYWGDMDAHGFEILSDLRGLFPHTVSVMMDAETLTTYSEYVVKGVSSRSERFVNLTADEAKLVQMITEQNLRLEQERIPHDAAVLRLKPILNT